MPSKNRYLLVSALVLLFTLQGCSSAPKNTDAASGAQTPSPVAKILGPFQFSQKPDLKTYADKYAKLMQELLASSFKKGNSFFLAAYPLDKYTVLLGNMETFANKRYTDEQIRNEYKTGMATLNDGNIHFVVVVQWVGDLYDNSELAFDDRSYEYFFLENEKQNFIKASKIDFQGAVLTTVNTVNPTVQFMLSFPQAELENMMKDSKQLFLTFNGLKIVKNDKDNRIELKYPFEEYYKKDFPEAIKMVQEMEGS